MTDSDKMPLGAEPQSADKRFATLRAELALHGFVLRRLDDGTFICTRWHIARDFATLADCERFCDLVTGRKK